MQDKIKQALMEAMRAKDAARATTLKGVKSAFTNELVTLKRKPDGELSDDEATTVIKRLAKQRKDSIAQFEAGGRPELAEGEKAELAILQEFLPEELGEDAIRPVVEAKIAELGATDKSKMGEVMAAVMQELKGQADGAMVKKLVDESLS